MTIACSSGCTFILSQIQFFGGWGITLLVRGAPEHKGCTSSAVACVLAHVHSLRALHSHTLGKQRVFGGGANIFFVLFWQKKRFHRYVLSRVVCMPRGYPSISPRVWSKRTGFYPDITQTTRLPFEIDCGLLEIPAGTSQALKRRNTGVRSSCTPGTSEPRGHSPSKQHRPAQTSL